MLRFVLKIVCAYISTVCLDKGMYSLEGQDRALVGDLKPLSGFCPKPPPQITLLKLQVISFPFLYVSRGLILL